MNLNQITLPASNMKDSVAFYLRMGFTQIVDTPHYARFRCPEGASTFSLALRPQTAIPPDSGVTVYFESTRLDALVAELEEQGITFISPPRDERYLWREARLRDPDGHLICLYYAGDNRLSPPWKVEISAED